MTAEQRVLDWIRRADFDGTGCRHSQGTIAKALGYSREHVNRCTKKLAADGRLRTAKERRPGCQWPCNVYYVEHWTPHKRSGVLAVLDAIYEARLASCHTERTARPSRAQTTPQNPSSPQSQNYQRCGRARGTHQNLARRRRMCDCRQCAETIEKVTTELSGAMHTVRKLGAENLRLRGAGTHNPADDPKTANVWFLLENWLWLCRGRKRSDGKGRLPVIDPGSKRWTITARALNREPEGALACIEAIEGLAAKPYVTNSGRQPHGRPSERYDDIEYALKDETTVERCRRYRAEVLGASEAVLFHSWQQCSASDHFYFMAWTGKRARDEFDQMPEHKRIAHRMRVAEAYDDAEQARVIELDKRRNRSAA